MYRQRFKLAIVLPVLLWSGHLASSKPSNFCVDSVLIDKTKTEPPYSQSNGPSVLRYKDTTDTPFPVDFVNDPPNAQTYVRREVFWHIEPDFRIVGPTVLGEKRVTGTDGRLLYLIEPIYDKASEDYRTGQASRHLIWSLAIDGSLQRVDGPWSENHWRLAYSGETGDSRKVVFTGWRQGEEIARGQRYFALKNNRVEELGEDPPFTPTKVFGTFDVGVGSHHKGLAIKHKNAEIETRLLLPHTTDHGWWESLHIDRYGWLFAEGSGNDYAIKLDLDHEAKVKRINRFTGRGWFGRMIEWIFGFGPESEISSTQWSSQCVDYSPALQLTLFCDPMKVLRNGQLHSLPKGASALDRYVGDVNGASVALIKGQENELYAFDGDELQLVAKDFGNYLKVQEVPKAGRTFITAADFEKGTSHTFEVRGKFPKLKLVDLASLDLVKNSSLSPSSQTMPSSFGRLMAFPGSTRTLAINQDGVWEIGTSSFRPIWRRPASKVKTAEIAEVPAWDGLLLLTQDKTAHLITYCER